MNGNPLPKTHPLERAVTEALRTMSPVTLTQEEAAQCYQEIVELYDRRKASMTHRIPAGDGGPW